MTEEERIELLPEPLRTQAKKLLSIRPEELPEVPEKGKWYVYRPEGCVCSTGTPYMSTLRIGKENKLMVVFCGGGCAVDAHAAARPGKTGEAGESPTRSSCVLTCAPSNSIQVYSHGSSRSAT